MLIELLKVFRCGNPQILLTLLMLISSLAGTMAQEIPVNEKAVRFKELLDGGQKEEAYKHLTGWGKAEGNGPDLLFAYGQYYHSIKNYRLALLFVQQSLEKQSSPKFEHWFLLGEIRQKSNLFEEAIEAYQSAVSLATDPKETEGRISRCRSALKLKAMPAEVRIASAGKAVNTVENESRPFISPDGQLHFNRQQKEKVVPMQASMVLGLWEKVQENSTFRNSSLPDLRISGLSADGLQMILETSSGKGDLYLSGFAKGKWSDPKPFPGNSASSSESSASISMDGKILFFISDRSGNPDVWYCRKKGGNWQRPEKAGAEINTAEQEASPWMDAKGEFLYFSSRGSEGLGGLDIFRIPFGKKGARAENVGYPVNTSADDLDYMQTPDGKTACYVSNRDGAEGAFNIFTIRFGFAPPVKPVPPAPKPQVAAANNNGSSGGKVDLSAKKREAEEAKKNNSVAEDPDKPVPMALFKGTVTDVYGNPLNAVINISELGKKKTEASVMSNSETGTFLAKLPMGKSYSVMVEKEGFLFYSDLLDFLDAGSEQDLDKKIKLQKLLPGTSLVLSSIFFEPGKSSLRKESSNELQKILLLLRQNPTLKGEISSHIEPGGPEDVLQKLSENRARAVVDYLVATGIKAVRLVSRGYGSSKSGEKVGKNASHNGTRTEFRVISIK